MVKNTTGGTGAKSLARKHEHRGNNTLQLPLEPEYEKFACVTKMLGNCMCEIITNDNLKLIGHIRGKFKAKKNKRHNMITPNTIVLIGLRDMERPFKNCDILTIYDDNHVEQLRQIPNVDIRFILDLRMSTNNLNKNENYADIEFTEDSEDYFEEKIATTNKKEEQIFEIEETEEIDIDDI
jgi:initiation factor 1A